MATQTRGEAAEKRSGGGRASKRASRTTPALFFRQMVSELRKVIWPTRKELVTYTTVALVFILIMVGIVTALDYGFTRLVFVLFMVIFVTSLDYGFTKLIFAVFG